MIPILAVCLFTYTAFTLNKTILTEKARIQFADFASGGPDLRFLVCFVWLYALPPAMQLLPLPLAGFLLFRIPLAALVYIPGILVALNARRHFERAGTDRVDRLQRACDNAVGIGIGGVIYVLVICGATWAFSFVGH